MSFTPVAMLEHIPQGAFNYDSFMFIASECPQVFLKAGKIMDGGVNKIIQAFPLNCYSMFQALKGVVSHFQLGSDGFKITAKLEGEFLSCVN